MDTKYHYVHIPHIIIPAGEPFHKVYSPTLGRRTKRPSQIDWFAFMKYQRQQVNKVLGRFYLQKLHPEEFADEMFQVLRDAHVGAQVLGRQRSGVLGAATDDDRSVALFHMQQQGGFLAGFAADLVDKLPRYWDEDKKEWKKRMVTQRAQMYASRLRGTANIAFEAYSDEDAEFEWKLGIAEHCSDCLSLAAESPHKKGELPVFPGDAGTECLVNCKCVLVRSDGITGFPPDPRVGKWDEPDQRVGDSPITSLPGDSAPNISASIDLGGLTPLSKKNAAEALAIIDSIHGDGVIPPIVTESEHPLMAGARLGGYLESSEAAKHGIKPKMLLTDEKKGQEFTVMHEVGHVIEIEGLGAAGGIVKQEFAPHWNRVGKAISKSKHIDELKERLEGVEDDGLAEYLKYLLAPEELWARAYAQYIATALPKKKLKRQLRASKDADTKQVPGLYRQWDDDDFEPIMEAITKALAKEKWLRN